MLNQTLDLVREHNSKELPYYTQCVTKAFAAVDPVFLRQRYGQFFFHCASTVPVWLAQVVLGNAQAESDGAAKLLTLWQDVSFNKPVEDQILFHATDEARHSRLFVRLAETTFPTIFSDGVLSKMRSTLARIEKDKLHKSAVPITPEVLIDHLVQMNMGEIRTRLHMELLAPVLHAFAPEDTRDALETTLTGLAHDEIVHIGYIAEILDEMCRDGASDLVTTLYTQRLVDFHRFTVDQTESAVRNFGAEQLPDLLEI